MHKRFNVTGDHRVTLRLEAFNVFNHPVLSNPVTDLSNTNFGNITGASGGRNVQLGIKYAF